MAMYLTIKILKKLKWKSLKMVKILDTVIMNFSKNNDTIKIYNETNFEVKLLGIKVFSINSKGTEFIKIINYFHLIQIHFKMIKKNLLI